MVWRKHEKIQQIDKFGRAVLPGKLQALSNDITDQFVAKNLLWLYAELWLKY